MNTSELTDILANSSKRGVGLTKLMVLLHCAEHPGTKLSALAAMSGRSSANMTGIADALIDKGYAKRRSLRHDRRVWTLEITDHGFGVLHNILNLPQPITTTTTTV